MPSSRLLRLTVALGLLAGSAPAPLAAQGRVGASVDVNAARVTFDDFLPSAVYTVAPYVRAGAGLLDVAGRGAFSRFESGNRASTLGAAASLRTPEWRGWRAELAGDVARLDYDLAPRIVTADATGRLLHSIGPAAVAFGFSLGLTDDTAAVRNVRSGAVTLLGRALGTALSLEVAGRRIGAALVPAERAGTVDDVYTPPVQWGDARLDARWERSRVRFGVAAGTRFGYDPDVQPWAEATTTIRLARELAAVASFGRELSDPVRRAPGGLYAVLGLRWATRTSGALPVARARSGADRILPGTAIAEPVVGRIETRHGRASSTVRIWAPGARKVELMGDFTDWEPVLLARVGNWWLVTVPRMGAGPQRVNVRIDGGAWGVPSGVPVLRDDFDGASGVLIVPDA